jgi:hypothetical protein
MPQGLNFNFNYNQCLIFIYKQIARNDRAPKNDYI